MSKKSSVLNKLVSVVCVIVICISIVCVYVNIPKNADDSLSGLELAATGFTLYEKNIENDNAVEVLQNNTSSHNVVSEDDEPIVTIISRDYVESAEDGEVTYPIIESHIGGSGTAYDNFYIKNYMGINLNIGSLLNSKLTFDIADTAEPQVLIVHTHAGESYLTEDLGYYPESYYPRTTDNNYNVTRVGAAIAKSLNKAGIYTIHDTTQHDNPSYNGSYDRSLETINKYLEQYPSIKIVLDIHRDSLGYGGEQGKIKPVFVANGKKAAQIMIMSGCDLDGSLDFPDWEENLKFALKIQSKAETMYPGMTRPLDFGEFAYNMNVNTGSLLIEIGTDVNTLDEAVYSGELLGNVIANVCAEL